MAEPEINGNLTHTTSVEDLSEYTDADESISAPTEILAEFLSSIMMKDYKNALKYCRAILSYEPNNATAKEFYPLLLEKLEIMQKEEESDESSGDSSDSLCSSSSSGGSKKCSDSEDTSGSFTSLEDDTEDDKNNSSSAKSSPNLPMDLKNGNVNNIEANISMPTVTNNTFKKPVEDVENLDQIQRITGNRQLKSSLQSILIHPTETKTIKHSDSPVLSRTRTYVKNFSSELQNEVSINDPPTLEQQNTKKLNLQNANPKKMESAKKIKSSRASINRAKKI